MKNASPFNSAAAALFLVAVFGITLLAQAPSEPATGAAPAHEHSHGHGPMPPPTNLEVLPKTMTGEQVHELMHKWKAALGTECSTCHAADPARKAPNGRPMLNFADDSKPEKNTARLMFRMVEEINTQYISRVENSGVPVTCGTCHRGHLDPGPFVAPPDHDHDHDHEEHSAPPRTPQ